MTLRLRDALLNIPFKKGIFTSAFPGSIVFGETNLRNGVLEYSIADVFQVDYHKLEEFCGILDVLGRNILLEGEEEEIEPASKVMEICGEETIRVDNLTLVRQDGSVAKSSIIFDHFTYVHFVWSLKSVAFFIINPSQEEYTMFLNFLTLQRESSASYEELILDIAKDTDENVAFLKKMYLTTHLPLLRFCVQVKKLA